MRLFYTEADIAERVSGYREHFLLDFQTTERGKVGSSHTRVGTVVIRHDKEETVFAQAPPSEAYLYPAEQVPGYIYDDDEISTLDTYSYSTELENSSTARNIRQRLSSVALPLTGVVSAEALTTGSIWHDVAGFTVGALAAIGHRGIERTVRLAGMSERLDKVERRFETEGSNIRLPNQSRYDFIQDPDFLQEEVVVVVDGIETRRSKQSLLRRVGIYDDRSVGERIYAPCPDTDPHPWLEASTETSLWEEVEQRDSNRVWMFSDNDTDVDKAADYMRRRKQLAKELGLMLYPAKPPLKERLTPKQIKRKTRWTLGSADDYDFDNWEDASFTMVNLPPAKLVIQLLRHSKNPDKLWLSIEPVLVELADLHKKSEELHVDVTNHEKLMEHVGSNDELEIENQTVRRNWVDTKRALTNKTLSLIAYAERINEIENYMLQRDELLKSLENTYAAEDQAAAIQLVGAAFDAFLEHMPADSDESSYLALRLREYLQESMQFLVGNKDTSTVIYTGLREKFPQLQLPEVIGD